MYMYTYTARYMYAANRPFAQAVRAKFSYVNDMQFSKHSTY